MTTLLPSHSSVTTDVSMRHSATVAWLAELSRGASRWDRSASVSWQATLAEYDPPMRLDDAPALDVRPLLARERSGLITLLGELGADDWSRSTVCPGWTVKDVALHVIGDDLSLLSIVRDHDLSGLIPATAHRSDLITLLNAKNDAWVAAARALSPRIISGLLEWTWTELASHYRDVDLHAEARVGWASDSVVPMWLEVARSLTEHWLHQQQIRDAVGRPRPVDHEVLAPVVATLMWAVPHHYRSVLAPVGTEVGIGISAPGGGEWTLTRQADGWELDPTRAVEPAGRIELTSDASWRLFSGALPSDVGVSRLGATDLTTPFLSVRAFLV
jgi:uncharacterized protein (TIGR03083 family)